MKGNEKFSFFERFKSEAKIPKQIFGSSKLSNQFGKQNKKLPTENEKQTNKPEANYLRPDSETEKKLWEEGSNSKETDLSSQKQKSSEQEDKLKAESLFDESPDIFNVKKLLYNSPEQFQQEVLKMNEKACELINAEEFSEAVAVLKKSEDILEIAANSGKQLDRNLIIVILFNSSCLYQAIWDLENCAKYLDGVIFNLGKCIEEDILNLRSLAKESHKPETKEKIYQLHSTKIKKESFQIHCSLQYCAILSQIGEHVKALEHSRETQKVIQQLFKSSLNYARELKQETDFYFTQPQKTSKLQRQQQKLSSALERPSSQSRFSSTKQQSQPDCIRYDVTFTKTVVNYALPILDDLLEISNFQEEEANEQMAGKIKKLLYQFRNTISSDQVQQQIVENEGQNKRSLLGISNKLD